MRTGGPLGIQSTVMSATSTVGFPMNTYSEQAGPAPAARLEPAVLGPLLDAGDQHRLGRGGRGAGAISAGLAAALRPTDRPNFAHHGRRHRACTSWSFCDGVLVATASGIDGLTIHAANGPIRRSAPIICDPDAVIRFRAPALAQRVAAQGGAYVTFVVLEAERAPGQMRSPNSSRSAARRHPGRDRERGRYRPARSCSDRATRKLEGS